MKIINLILTPFKTCTILLLGLLLVMKIAFLNPDNTIKELIIKLKR